MYRKSIGTVIIAFALSGVVRADDQANASVILDKALAAHGGATNLSKFDGVYFKAKGTAFSGGQKVPLALEWFYQGSDKMRTATFDGQNKVAQVEVVNGKLGWTKDDKGTEPLSSEQTESRRELMYLNVATMLYPLKASDYRLSLVDDAEIAGRKAVGILVSHDKHDPLKLYFDKETHLFVKYQRKFKNVEVGKELNEECVYSDYRDLQGTKQAYRVETYWNGKEVSDLGVVEMKLYDKPMDEKLFERP